MVLLEDIFLDQESIVYGCIRDVPPYRVADERLQNNRDAILQLPPAEDWPFLCQEMFSLPGKQQDSSLRYQTEVIHFGASYKAVEYEWDQWIAHFEKLLSQMYWVSATVHLETELSGKHTFVWEAHEACHVPGSGNVKVKCEWSHEGFLHG